MEQSQSQSEHSPFVMSAVGSEQDGDENSAFPNSPDPLKAAWNAKIVNEYFNPVSMASNNRGWKTLEEIDTLMYKIRLRNDFEIAKGVQEAKINRKYGTKEYDKLPDEVRRLYKLARENGGFGITRSTWSIREEEGKEYVFKNKSKTTKIPNDYHKMIGMENSYDFLMGIHLELGHLGATGLLDYLAVNKLGCFPRALVQHFHRYCPLCSHRKKEKEVLKMSQKKEKEVEIIEYGLLIVATVTVKCQDVLKGTKTVLFALFRRTSYVLCFQLENDYDISSLVDNLLRGLMHAGIPRNMYLYEFNREKKDEVRLYDQIATLHNQS